MNPKEIILGTLTVIAGVMNAYLWRELIVRGDWRAASVYSLPVVALFVFAILFALSASFIKHSFLRNSSAILAGAGGYLFIPHAPGVLALALLSALGAWYAADAIAAEYASASYFSARKIFRGGLPIFFTAAAVMLSVFYYVSASGEKNPVLLPKAVFDVALPLLEQPLQGILPGFQPGASIDDLILTLAAKQSARIAGQAGLEADISKLPAGERDKLVREGRRTLSEQLGLPLTGREKSGEVLYKAANIQITKFAGPYEKYFPLIAAAGFFIAIKSITLPIYWITLLLVFFVVKLLIATKILKEETETIQVKRITL